jgi:hypothetical protein
MLIVKLVPLEGDQVLGICLGIMVRHMESTVASYKEWLALYHEHPASRHPSSPDKIHRLLMAIQIRDTVRAARRIGCIAGKVDSLAVRCRVLAAKRPIEPLIHYRIDHISTGAVPQPTSFKPLQNLLLHDRVGIITPFRGNQLSTA